MRNAILFFGLLVAGGLFGSSFTAAMLQGTGPNELVGFTAMGGAMTLLLTCVFGTKA
jgi:hypothetical protein